MTGQTSFSVSFNFTTPDDIVSILKKYNAVYNKKRREWTTSISAYKECAIEVSTFCKGRGVYVDLIPQQVFDLHEYAIPFTDPAKQKIMDYDYEDDFLMKPTLS